LSRILFLTERYPPDAGGVSASAGRIASSLAALGASVDVVAWTRTLQAGQVARAEGNPASYRIGRFRQWDSTLPHTLNLLDWLISQAPYDLVWGHYLSLAGFVATWFGRLYSVPSIVSIRGNDLDRDIFPPGDFSRLQWTLNHATAITAVTQELARKAYAIGGREEIVHLRNVVDTGKFFPAPQLREPVRARLGINPVEALLGFCGELREKKGQDHLLNALLAVRRVRPARLLLIGDVRPTEMPRLMQFIPPGSLEEHVIITGQLASPEAVNEHLQACDVYLQPSLWDGMPNALLEAMAAGCGCIASDAGGIPEIINPGEDGVVIPRWQLHRLGEAVLEWLDADRAHKDRIRQAARARMVAEFSPDRERQDLQELLARVIPSSAQTSARAAPERSQE
jgi:glycosyltransferase involved in cell wall biosynthesis